MDFLDLFFTFVGWILCIVGIVIGTVYKIQTKKLKKEIAVLKAAEAYRKEKQRLETDPLVSRKPRKLRR